MSRGGTILGNAFPNDDVPLREEVLPIHGIRVRFDGYPISRIHLEPEGLDLTPVREKDSLTVSLPPLAIHSMVVAELTEF